jgi:hypothetical protein
MTVITDFNLFFRLQQFMYIISECESLTRVALRSDRDVQHNRYKVHPTPGAGGDVSALPAPAVRAIELIQADLMFITC